MNIKKLDRAKKIYERILVLDSEIIEIDKLANSIANEEVEVKINLSVKSLTKEQEEENKVTIDEDGSLLRGDSHCISFDYRLFLRFRSTDKQEKPKEYYTHKLERIISENTSLNILGLLLLEKRTERDDLIKQLNKLGVTE